MNVHAEVIDTSMAYKEIADDNGRIYPKGTIKVRFHDSQNNSGQPVESYATPLNANDFEIPITGEHVLLSVANTSDTSIRTIKVGYFYSKPVNSVNNLNSNILTGFYNTRAENTGDSTLNKGIRNVDQASNPYNPPVTYTFNTNSLSFLQPFEGDHILQSRFGSAIRFTSTIKGNTGVYTKQASWTGESAGSPLIIISSGISSLSADSNKYDIENINDDKSSIYITTDQQLDLTMSQPINDTISAINGYNKPQVILNSERLVFNSKTNSIVLSAAETIGMSTPDWKLDMNKFFNLMFQFVEEVTKIANKQETIATGVGPTGLATNVAKFVQIVNDLTLMKSNGGNSIVAITTPVVVADQQVVTPGPAAPVTDTSTNTSTVNNSPAPATNTVAAADITTTTSTTTTSTTNTQTETPPAQSDNSDLNILD